MKKQNNFTLGLIAAILMINSSLSAATVSIEKAQTVAINFFAQAGNTGQQALSAQLVYTRTESDNTVDFYVFNISPKGFVIVSANDIAKPVIAYSTKSNFNSNFGKHCVADWMNHAAAHIHNAVQINLTAKAEISNQWSNLIEGGNQNRTQSLNSSVAPLIHTTWDQEPYYNELCPYNTTDQRHCETGCVATVMGQIMKYWNYPLQGTGSYGYSDHTPFYTYNYGNQYANFGATTYNWQSMPDSLTSSNTAVATLMYQLGVGVAMDYGDDMQGGSGAYVLQADAQSWQHTAQYAYMNYFGYNPTTLSGVYASSYTSAAWVLLLKHELNEQRPIQYEGRDTIYGGHTWIIDGYDQNDMFHMNWGWSGIDDGYFSLSDLTAYGYHFNSNEAALIGIEPIVNMKITAAASKTEICPGDNLVLSAHGPGAGSYSWAPTSGLECALCAHTEAHPTANTVYTVTYDSSGFTATATVVINVHPAMHIAHDTVNNVSCAGNVNGAIGVSVAGGTPSYSYLWSNGETSTSLSGVGFGNYSLTVSDAMGCSFFSSFFVSQPDTLSLSISSINASCNNIYGSAVANVTGGSNNFSYFWSNGLTTDSVSSLSAGTYGVTVTDTHGCAASASVTFTQAVVMEISTSSSNGEASVSNITNGLSPYSFVWSNGDSSQTINNVANGTYTVTVIDNGGCEQTATASVNNVATSINEVAQQVSFEAYPNPAQNNVTVHVSKMHGDASIEVKSVLGQTLISRTISEIQSNIDLSELNNGVYFIELTQGGKTSTQELVVKK